MTSKEEEEEVGWTWMCSSYLAREARVEETSKNEQRAIEAKYVQVV